jgi:hypothetical protein
VQGYGYGSAAGEGAIAALKDSVCVPPCVEGWRFELFVDGEAVEVFSRGLEGLLVVAEVLHGPGV